MREKVTALTKPANCMSCHDLINATGFTLEGFDATGKTRTKISGKSLDLQVNYLDKEGNELKWEGPQALLKQALNSSKSTQNFVEELAKHLVKQPIQSYSNLKLNELSKMLYSKEFKLSQLYLKIAMQAASEGFVYQP
jgi:hypothetical protein